MLLLLIGLAALAAGLLVIPWAVQAQEATPTATPTAGATGESPPAKPTNLQPSAEHDEVALTWTASTDQTVTHYAILRRNRDTEATGVFHVIDSNAGPETSYTDSSVSAESKYNYRVKAVSPTGVSQWSGFVKADTPAAPDPAPAPTPTPTPTPEPGSTADNQASTNLTAALAEGSGVTLNCTRSEGGSMKLETDSQEQNAHPAPARTPRNRVITTQQQTNAPSPDIGRPTRPIPTETPKRNFASRKQQSGD